MRKRWYDRILPRSLRPGNGAETAKQRALEARVAEQRRRVDALANTQPDRDYEIRLRDALLRGM